MITHNKHWFRKRLAAKPFCSFHSWTTDSCKPNGTQPIQRKCDITNFFTKILSSNTSTTAKRLRRGKKWKKRGKERSEKRRIRRTIIALENFKGLLRIVASLIKNGQRKILVFSQSKKTPLPIFVQFSQRKLVVPIKLSVMFSDTVKHLFKLSLKMKWIDNTKLRNLMIF